jgi:predicted aspartyl protease
MRGGLTGLVVVLLASGTGLARDLRQQLPLHSVGTHTYYVSAHIAGLGRVPMLVDTGAGFSALSEGILRHLEGRGEAVFVKRFKGIMADGSERTVPVYRIRRLRLGPGCGVRDIEVVVFPGASRQILGLSALRKLAPFSISLDPPSITLSNCLTGPQAPETAAGTQTRPLGRLRPG